MKISEVNNSLVGKKVSFVFTGLRSTGTVTGIYEDKYTKGLEIDFDNPIQWGDDFYTHMQSTSRKSFEIREYNGKVFTVLESGNLEYTELI